MPYIRGASKQAEQQLTTSIRDTKKECARLARQLQGVQNELEALRKARDIINQAHRDARVIREQAYDFGLAQLDREYATREHRNRERQVARTKLITRYGRERLKAATKESMEWDARQKESPKPADTTSTLCEEIEWQLESGEGWYQAMKAVGYESPDALARQLYRLGRRDLASKFAPKNRATPEAADNVRI